MSPNSDWKCAAARTATQATGGLERLRGLVFCARLPIEPSHAQPPRHTGPARTFSEPATEPSVAATTHDDPPQDPREASRSEPGKPGGQRLLQSTLRCLGLFPIRRQGDGSEHRERNASKMTRQERPRKH